MAKLASKLTREEKRNLRKKEKDELEDLKKRINDLDLDECKKYTKFEQLPISKETLKGLKTSSFISMTDIQKATIPVVLKGDDIMGAAKTGSGKTLSFLIPVIERLNHESWGEFDGLGALIITPTRELAMQIYEVLLKIGKYHTLSAALVTGGKAFEFEQERIGKMNILIGTPGRLLQHMHQSATFNADNLQMLVLDEADRLLDMGFKAEVDGIISGLLPDRQTMLFSATQTKSIQDLARLSLVNPKYINTSSDDDIATPKSLEQSYVVCELNEKIDILWSFIKSHLNSKILVFASSSKQVHFIYESLRKLQPGISLMKLHGRQKQKARLETTVKFTQAQHCCLFATDIVARGLDFPAIDWVVQIDCPEDVATYIHRVGRCARFGRAGKSLLMLTPSEEEGFLRRLETKKIEIKRLNIKNSKKKSIQDQLQSLCFKDPQLKYLGQKAFISYTKSVFIQKDKDVFDVTKLPLEAFAKSLGLPGEPKISFLENARSGKKKELTDLDLQKLKEKKNASRQLKNLSKLDENGELIEKEKKVRTKYDKMFERQNQNVLSDHYLKMTNFAQDGDEEEEDDDFMAIKRRDHELKDDEIPDIDVVNTSKRATKKALSRKLTAKSAAKGYKLVFDDDGVAHPIYELEDEEDFHKKGDAETQKKKFLEEEAQVMAEADIVDKGLAREKRQEKKRKRKEMERRQAEMGYSDESGSDGGEFSDLDRDMEYSDAEDEDKDAKRPKKWFEKDIERDDERDDGLVEYEQPEGIDDLEALTERLMNE